MYYICTIHAKYCKDMKTIDTPKNNTFKKGSKQCNMASKMLDNKKAIFAHFRGEITSEELNAKGIKRS